MSLDRQQAIDYLRAPANGLWRWTESGGVLIWRDGDTIAFREEIVQILQCLAPNGIPPFGELVLLLAACRGKIPDQSDVLSETSPAGPGPESIPLSSERQRISDQLAVLRTQLAKVAQLPSELNAGIKARCVLAEAVFESRTGGRYLQPGAILNGMSEPLSDADLVPGEGGVRGRYFSPLTMLANGLKNHTAESLALRMRTGLDALPNEIDGKLSTAERVRGLITELSRDRDLGAVARAAHQLMAVIKLPRHLNASEQLAVGGVADITNRGPLDRLLLSELAHDDLTLSVRVALNEALFLRREPPMREPPVHLALLLDSGLRLWGVPRVLATAVAMALIARDKQRSEVSVWRSRGKQLIPVDLLARQGLLQHLAALETEVHPGEAIPAFAELVNTNPHTQSVLITTGDTLEDPEFRQVLSNHSGVPHYIAVVDRSGHLALHATPVTRRPPVCEAGLDLAAVFGEETRISSANHEVDPNLPAIFGVVPFPFLLPLAGKIDFCMKAADGFIYAVLNDRRLVRFRGHQAGAHVLASDLPGGKTLWLDCIDDVVKFVKANASQRPARLLALPLAAPNLLSVDLVTGDEIRAVHCQGEVILLIRDADVRAYALDDGSLLGRSLNPHKWVNGRFFRGENLFYFCVWDGQKVKFEPITLPNSYSASVIVAIFDRKGVEGPWLVHQSGTILSMNNKEQVKLPMPAARPFGIDEVRISRDGHRLYASITSMNWGRFQDLESGRGRGIDPSHSQRLELEPAPRMPTWNVQRVFFRLGRVPDGLAICGRADGWRRITLNGRDELHLGKLPDQEIKILSNVVSFAAAKPTKRGCLLQLAEWPCGSKAYLDSRGILHLKSHDLDIPELSLILAEGEVAGWTADGHICGPRFFFEIGYNPEPKRVFERLIQFLTKL